MFFFVWYMYAVHMFLSWWWFRPIDKLVITESCRRTCSAADQGERVRGRTPSPFSGNLIWKTNKQTFNAHLKASFTIYNLHTIIIANKCFKNRAVTEFRKTDWNLLHSYENEKKTLSISSRSKVLPISIRCLFHWVYTWEKKPYITSSRIAKSIKAMI